MAQKKQALKQKGNARKKNTYGRIALILNPVVTVLVVVGMIMEVDTTILIVGGVIGYGIWFVYFSLAMRMSRRSSMRAKR